MRIINRRIENVLEIGDASSPRSFYFDNRIEKYAMDPLMGIHNRLYPNIYKDYQGLVEGVAETMNFADNSFDTIILSNCLDHFADPQASLNEVFRILKSDGVVFIGNEIFPLLWKIERKFRDKVHEYRWTYNELKSVVENSCGLIKGTIKNPNLVMNWQFEIYATTFIKKLNVKLGRRNVVWLFLKKFTNYKC